MAPSRTRSGRLLEKDIVEINGSIRLYIRRSKTDIFGKGAWILLRPVGGVRPVRFFRF